jgi:protein-S-isoprenylcysteine O-methyltransferase Ste14
MRFCRGKHQYGAAKHCLNSSYRGASTLFIRLFKNAFRAIPADAFLQLIPGAWHLTSRRAFDLAGRAWTIWALWWLAMAFLSKSTKRRESVAQRIEHLVPAILGFMLIFRKGFGGSWLARPIWPANPVLLTLCVIATVLGLLFAVWARLILGSNWSGTVTIKTNHQLIRRGPYRSIRHPIYTGMLTALLATAMIQGLLSGMIGFAFVLLALYRKATREETFLSQEFGEGFSEHRQQTGMFLPRFS